MIEEHLRSKEDRSNIPNPLEQRRKTRSTFPSEEILCSSPVPLVVSSTRSSTVSRNICSFERCPNIASNFCSPLFARFARLFEQSQRIRKTACSFSRRRKFMEGVRDVWSDRCANTSFERGYGKRVEFTTTSAIFPSAGTRLKAQVPVTRAKCQSVGASA